MENHYTGVSLCSGIGGLDLAASLAGFNIVAQVEIDPYCRRVLAHHAPKYWPHSKLYEDTKAFGYEKVQYADFVFGGFPCQPFSVAGKQEGELDSRNLWPDFARIIGELRPRVILLENVPGLLSPNKATAVVGAGGKHGLTRIRRRRYTRPSYALKIVHDLTEMGYVSRWGIVSAADAGAAHLRKRWWLVAYADSNRSSEPQPRTSHQYSYNEKRDNPQGNQIGRAELHAA